MKNKIFIALLLIVSMAAALNVHAKNAEETSEELIVFAAASMTETLTELGDAYMEDHEKINIVFNFDSSGTLKTQIEEGADADIFISAGQKQMDQLEELDCILPDTRFDILENKVALTVPEDNPKDIHSFEDMVAGLQDGSILLAMGNEDVPVGQYTQKILSYYDLSEEDLAAAGSVTYGTNVKEVTTQISESAVDCGIIYQTDAFSAGLTIVDTAAPEMCGQVIYPAAITNASKNSDLAKEFLDFLTTKDADAVFENVGFTPVAD